MDLDVDAKNPNPKQVICRGWLNVYDNGYKKNLKVLYTFILKIYTDTSYMVQFTTQEGYSNKVSKAQGVFIQIFKALAIFWCFGDIYISWKRCVKPLRWTT